jgi:hypothetical protein
LTKDNFDHEASLLKELGTFGAFDDSVCPIIYHYCSTSTFLAIIERKRLRLSDVNTMNDYGEAHWAYDKFIQAINNDLNKYDRKFFDYVDEFVSGIQLLTLPLISCFSMEGDMLSQWRAYADNGLGVALGVDAGLIKRLAARCGQVVYDEARQISHFRKFLFVAHRFWKIADAKPELRGKLQEFLFMMAFDLCLMKNSAFSEENEVRLARATEVKKLDDGSWNLSDSEGSSADAVSNAAQQICHRAALNGGVIAYIDLPLEGLGRQLVKDVVIGPRSPNNGVEVSMALASQGFGNFKVRKSKITYR